MDLLDPRFLLLGIIASALIFAVVAFWASATTRRIVGALVSSLPIVPLVMLYDAIAAQFGWWHYPPVTTSTAPLAWYIAAALVYGAALGLVGWRVIRRFHTRGLVAFLIVFALLGVMRDYAYSSTTRLIVFGPGLLPLVADWFAYASAAALLQLLMYWIVGPPRSDPLARTQRTHSAADA